MSEGRPAAASSNVVCPVCGAEQGRQRASCWMCGAALGAEAPPPGSPASFAPAAEASSAHFSFSISTLLLITTLVAVCCALVSAIPGLGVMICILLVPVVVRTAKVVERREAAGGHVSAAEKIALGATSFAATTVIVIVVAFATFCCFCAVCATFIGLAGNEQELFLLGLAAAAGAAVAIFVCVKLFKSSRRRFQRDMEVPPRHGP
jgi:hypothetical protein